MRKTTRKCLALIFLASVTQAQEPLPVAEPLADEVPEVRRYTIELIVFRYAEEVSVGTEIFQAEVVEPIVPEDALPLDQELDREVVEDGVDTAGALFRMVLLAEDEFTMIDTYDRLDRLDAYEPLLHIGWTQTALPEDQTPALDLREFGKPPANLHGAFTLYLSRYLHLVVNLELDAPNNGAGRTYNGYAYSEPEYAPLTHLIDENRLFKNGETRYFDHPKFGVVAKILRYEEPEVIDSPDDTEFLSPVVGGH